MRNSGPIDDLLQMSRIVHKVIELAVDRQDGAFSKLQCPPLEVTVEQAQVIGINRVYN